MRKTKGVPIKRVQSINSKKEHGQQFANICIWKPQRDTKLTSELDRKEWFCLTCATVCQVLHRAPSFPLDQLGTIAIVYSLFQPRIQQGVILLIFAANSMQSCVCILLSPQVSKTNSRLQTKYGVAMSKLFHKNQRLALINVVAMSKSMRRI